MQLPSKTESMVELELDTEQFKTISGHFEAEIEVMCAEFQSFTITVKAFVGGPLFSPVSELVFIKPCRIGARETLKLFLINRSQYVIDLMLKNTPIGGGISGVAAIEGARDGVLAPNPPSTLTCTLSMDESQPTRIQPCSLLQFTITFEPRRRGPVIEQLELVILAPSRRVFPLSAFGLHTFVVGLCMEPQTIGSDTDLNHMDEIREWLSRSHAKHVVETMPMKWSSSDAEMINAPETIICATAFKSDTINFRPAPSSAAKVAGAGDEDTGGRVVVSQRATIVNSGEAVESVELFTSSGFKVEPAKKMLLGGKQDMVDISYVPPVNAHNMMITYGFAAVLQEKTRALTTVQVLGKHQPVDLFVFPVSETVEAGKEHVLDFGVVEKTVQEMSTDHFISRNLQFYNGSASNISWELRMGQSNLGSHVFEPSALSGDIKPFESMVIPVIFRAENVGAFEIAADLFAKDMFGMVSGLMVASNHRSHTQLMTLDHRQIWQDCFLWKDYHACPMHPDEPLGCARLVGFRQRSHWSCVHKVVRSQEQWEHVL